MHTINRFKQNCQNDRLCDYVIKLQKLKPFLCTRDSLYLLQTQHPEQAPPLWPGYRILLLLSKGPLLHPHHFLLFLSCEIVLRPIRLGLFGL